MQTQTAAIILAAGTSSRMNKGQHKLLLPLGNKPVLAHVLVAALASQARPIVLVLGYGATQIRTGIAAFTNHPTIILRENAAYAQGMSTSLHLGVQTLLDLTTSAKPVTGALILLGDQPLVTSTIIDEVIKTQQINHNAIVTPLYAGVRSNPTLFSRQLFAELLRTTGDEGGRKVVADHQQEIKTVEINDASACLDVDTWEAYQQVMVEWERRQSH